MVMQLLPVRSPLPVSGGVLAIIAFHRKSFDCKGGKTQGIWKHLKTIHIDQLSKADGGTHHNEHQTSLDCHLSQEVPVSLLI